MRRWSSSSICPLPYLTSTSQSRFSQWFSHLRGVRGHVPAVDPCRSGHAPTLRTGQRPTIPAAIIHRTLATKPTSRRADQCKVSATIVSGSEENSYVFKVHGYSRAKELFWRRHQCMTSPPFCAGGYNWVLRYYPNYRFDSSPFDYINMDLDSADAKNVMATARFSVLDKGGLPVEQHSELLWGGKFFPSNGVLGHYINRADLEQSEHIIGDCLSIRCDLVLKKTASEEIMNNLQCVLVPPSDLDRHFGNLLESMDGADVTFHVSGEKILAHRTILAARSTVFKAELLGPTKENVGSPIEIHDMEADVFKSLIHFIYTDSPPALEMACNEGLARPDLVMASHLLVAAERYNIGRLKLICEHKLCSHIDANTVATSLVIAEQHSCNVLKEACLQFLASPSNFEAMMSSDGYEHLKSICPSVLREFIASLLPVEWKVAKEFIMKI